MKSDVFVNPIEWEDALNELRQLRDSKTLDEHQAGLVRILRCPHNWCLRAAALGVIRQVNDPTDELLKETLSIALNDNVYVEARAIAVDALADLMIKNRRVRSKDEMTSRSGVLKRLEDLMEKTDFSLLRESIEAFFEKLANR